MTKSCDPFSQKEIDAGTEAVIEDLNVENLRLQNKNVHLKIRWTPFKAATAVTNGLNTLYKGLNV